MAHAQLRFNMFLCQRMKFMVEYLGNR